MDHVLLRTPNTEAIAVVDQAGNVERLTGVGVPLCRSHAWSRDGRLAYSVKKGRAIHLWQVGEGAERLAPIIPPIAVEDVEWLGDCLAVGGTSNDDSRVWVARFAGASVEWQPLETPEELLNARKGVDAVVTVGDVLVAVDNIIFPKWFVSYDATAPELPLIACHAMWANGTYERVINASGGQQLFAVLSKTMGRLGPGRHLVLYDPANAEVYISVDAPADREGFAMSGQWIAVFRKPGQLDLYDLTQLAGRSSETESLGPPTRTLAVEGDYLRKTRLGALFAGDSLTGGGSLALPAG